MSLNVDSQDLEQARGESGRSNAEVARLFDAIGDVLEIKGELPFKVRAYRVAAQNVAHATESLESLFVAGRLREIHGVGQALEAKIVEYLATGKMDAYERLKSEFPSDLAALLEVPGLGPTRARAVYGTLHVASVADLERVALSGQLRDVPGFGPRAVEQVLESLERMKDRTTRHLISTGWRVAGNALAWLGERTDPAWLAIAGSVRRMQEPVGNVDLLTADPTCQRSCRGCQACWTCWSKVRARAVWWCTAAWRCGCTWYPDVAGARG